MPLHRRVGAAGRPFPFWARITAAALLIAHPLRADFNDPNADRAALPQVPPGFVVTEFAREPLVRQPCSMAFDDRGRLFVGMGPQYRNPRPETPGDSVTLLLDTDGDGAADQSKVFATGFNAIQGLAWHGGHLWVANAPDLTVVVDVDGDDEADQYVRIYTDLGNLEHGLHGLNWAPDGKLYMSKGNSKGLTQPGRVAPKAFRELWGVAAPRAPDFPPPQTFARHNYRRAYHDPADDWGREGGVLRCDDGGANLEIVSRGFRNPWDIAFDDGFNWLGTDNDQTMGDRVFMPFWNAHFGWNHAWSSHWTTAPHPPTAPVSGPLFEGSGTGLVYYDQPQFPAEFRGVFFINDWLQKTTFVWRPQWDGALLRPRGGTWTPFVEGGRALFRPTDSEVGPDGALWILGWSAGYGAEWQDGQMTSEGRVFRVAAKAPQAVPDARPQGPRANWSVDELISEFARPLPIWRSAAQDELVRRGAAVRQQLAARLEDPQARLTTGQQTWLAWTVGRIGVDDRGGDDFFLRQLSLPTPAPQAAGATAASQRLNLQIQAARILGHRLRGRGLVTPQPLLQALEHPEPRLRMAAVQAASQAGAPNAAALVDVLAREGDPTVYYAAWQGLSQAELPGVLRSALGDRRGGVRRGALLALLEREALAPTDVQPLVEDDDEAVRRLAGDWLKSHAAGQTAVIRGRPLDADSALLDGPPLASSAPPVIRAIEARSGRPYRAAPGGLRPGGRVYTDREYSLARVPLELLGADMIQTANDDDGSQGAAWLTFEARLPVRVYVALDTRHGRPPKWLAAFRETGLQIHADHWTCRLYSRDFPAGPVTLGGNTDDGVAGGKGNYFVVANPLPFSELPAATSVDDVLPLLERAAPAEGELLFKHRGGAGCSKCHSLGERPNGFGPELSRVGRRASARHLIQSMLDPSEVITEGFSQQIVRTDEGESHAGVLLEESGLTLTLGLASGEQLTLGKARIESRKSTRVSAMPSVGRLLRPRQVADLTAFLLAQRKPPTRPRPPEESLPPNDQRNPGAFAWRHEKGRLAITLRGRPAAEFVYRDPKILRPYFANLRLIDGRQLTRNHPPQPSDSQDHDTMHPGVWLAFGDLSGADFWRNKGRLEHVRFTEAPAAGNGELRFAFESRLKNETGALLGTVLQRCRLTERPDGWRLLWDATFRADQGAPLTFGDQEEMGFGARMATPLTELNGGTIFNSEGRKTAGETWGRPADWCDYGGMIDGRPCGVTLFASPLNFRRSWWHTRNYGVFVANPFGRAAMKQGDPSRVAVAPGKTLQIVFAAEFHGGANYDPEKAYRDTWRGR